MNPNDPILPQPQVQGQNPNPNNWQPPVGPGIQGSMQNIPPPYPGQLPAMQPKKSKKPWIVFVIVLLLVVSGGAGAYWYMVIYKDTGKTTNPNAQNPDDTPAIAHNASFYVALKPGEINSYTPVAKDKGLRTLPEHPAFYSNSITSNQGLQYAKDAKLTAYAIATYTENAGGDVDSIPNSTIYTNENGTETELFKTTAPDYLDDWIISLDGSTVYYISSTQKNPGQQDGSVIIHNLYKLDVSTKKSTLIKADFPTAASRLYTVDAGDLRAYSTLDGTITEHRYSADTYTATVLGTVPCTPLSLSYPQALSPDGTQLLVNCLSDGLFSYFTVDIAAKTNKKIYALTSAQESLRAAYWSPDGKQIAFDIAGYGADLGTVNNRVDIFDLTAGSITNVFAAPAAYAGRMPVEVLGWSHDGTYIAYAHKGIVNIYDTATKLVITTELEIGTPVVNTTAFGWTK